MNDRLTKAFLAAIALGLWANAMNPWIRPTPAAADVTDVEIALMGIESVARDIREDVRKIDRVLRGFDNPMFCKNPKICAGQPPSGSN